MIRIAKLTDYAMLILTILGKDLDISYNASQIAELSGINHPTVAKLLKQLLNAGILTSSRGSTGGYKLAYTPESLSIAKIIQTLEGPLAITECNISKDLCAIATQCTIQPPWIRINKVIHAALENYKLIDLIIPNSGVDNV
jgi:FeS assembly SUF system regulator